VRRSRRSRSVTVSAPVAESYDSVYGDDDLDIPDFLK
jgi:cell division protein FtsZ